MFSACINHVNAKEVAAARSLSRTDSTAYIILGYRCLARSKFVASLALALAEHTATNTAMHVWLEVVLVVVELSLRKCRVTFCVTTSTNVAKRQDLPRTVLNLILQQRPHSYAGVCTQLHKASLSETNLLQKSTSYMNCSAL